MAALHNGTQPRMWSPNTAFMAADPLSAPSGLLSSNTAFHASTRRQRPIIESPLDTPQDEGPPRKRLNRGRPQDAASMSPPLPIEPYRPSPRPRTVSDALSISSEDSLPDVSRLSSNTPSFRPPLSSTDTPVDPFTDPDFIKFEMTMPGEPRTRVRAAWRQSGYNFQRASALMSDPSWIPSSSSSPDKVEKDDVGRVKEVEEATRALRMAAKEKGKKSMIYANRITLETKAQSTPKIEGTTSVDTLQTPLTPIIARGRRKRPKALVLESESEGEAQSSDDGRAIKRDRVENSHESRALDYLNTKNSEGIQELTGKHFPII